jgi:hypothetical protein
MKTQITFACVPEDKKQVASYLQQLDFGCNFGVRVLMELPMLYQGWECDEYAWLVEGVNDGSKYLVETSHGKPCFMPTSSLERQVKMYRHAADLAEKAIAAVKAGGAK